ncbi:MAG: hypothetical protein V4493_04250 [Pseudomonadota bacterium]
MAVRYLDDYHYYWYETLQRSNEENWWERLKTYLQKQETYEVWFEKYKKLFSGPERLTVEVVESKEQYLPNDKFGITVSINLTYPTAEILDAMKSLLQEHQTTRVGTPDFDDCADVFQLASQPDYHTLKVLLDVYDLLNVSEELRPTLYEVGVQLKLSLQSVITHNDSPKDIRDKTTAMNSLVSRYYRWSRELIKNAEEGFFPIYGTIKKPKRNELGFFIHTRN